VYLKSLTLKGFKSFADRSVMTYEPGVTVIVGPNGSGKSNVTDAVLWVLGEQSAKQLRGQSMEDVIFAGSSARKPVGVAEVDLVLDNSDGTVPIDFTEITITRRMFRSGESEYYLNQSPARLMDIQDLLSDSGLGRDTHSIISQGRLDVVLNSRPEDRRALIEEAAGVLKHKKRKERALSKLRSMEGHADRVRDIVAEIERQLRPLERAADKAARHAEIERDLKELEVSVAVGELRELQSRWEGVLASEKEQDEALSLSRYRLTEKQRELEKFQGLLEERGLFAGDLSDQRRRLASVLERTNAGLLLLEEKGKNLVDRLSDLRATIHHADTRITARREELGRITVERGSTEARLKDLYASLGELRRESETIKKTRLAAEERVSEVGGATKRARASGDTSRLDLAKLEQMLSTLAMELELLGERETVLNEARTTTSATLSARRQRVERLERAVTTTRKELALAESDVDKRVRFLESRRRELEGLRDGLTTIRAEIRGLEEVDRAFQTASPALAWILSREDSVDGYIGPVSDLLTVDEELEEVVERALGPDLFCVLVRTRGDAETLLRRLSDAEPGDLSLMSLDVAAPPAVPADAPGTALLDFVDCDTELDRAVAALLGDVRLVDGLDAALAAAGTVPGVRFVTRAGHLVSPNGKIGFTASDSGTGVLTRKRRVNELKDDESAALSRLGDGETAASEAEETLAAAQQDALELSQRLAVQSGERDSLGADIGRLEETLAGQDREAELLAARQAEVAARADKERPGRERLLATIREAEGEVERLEAEVTARRDERDMSFREEAQVSSRLNECQVDIATVSEREVHLKRTAAQAAAEVSELERTLEGSQRTEAGLERLRERIEPLHDVYTLLLERAEHWGEKLRDRARFEAADSESLRSTIRAAQEAVFAAQGEIDAMGEKASKIAVEKGQLEVQVEAAVSRIVEDLEMPLERALELPSVDDVPKAQDDALRLRKRLNNLGPVNPVAMEEFESLRQRRDFLSEQLADVQATRQSLARVVRAIDRKMRDQFLQAFEHIDGHFQQVFTVLFPGGHARLAMTDPDDPDTTGIEVIAQPLGKKLSKMSLMSGGEKSLTALALLFALYRTRPSPFYVLDEVEAALDDTNLRRFVNFVDSLRIHTQFVIVSHQRRTMEQADTLYGVSMQADGVSKVVSQKLERDKIPDESPDDERSLV
jgi:chromosome segregation protein